MQLMGIKKSQINQIDYYHYQEQVFVHSLQKEFVQMNV